MKTPKLPENNVLGATLEPTEENRYKARDGLYYNGYMLSSDCAHDAFDEAWQELRKSIEETLKKNGE